MHSRPSTAPKPGTRRVPLPPRMLRERPRQWRCGGATPTSAATHAPAGASGDSATSAGAAERGWSGAAPQLEPSIPMQQACPGEVVLDIGEDPCRGLLSYVHMLGCSSMASMQVCQWHAFKQLQYLVKAM